ncbi:MAG: hypothetical protein WC809_03855 [Sinimarinibacterium sp.]|jgi:hypothetical protein
MDEALRLQGDFRAHVHIVLRRIMQSITGLEPGPRRLFVAVEAYWEACLARRAERIAMMTAAKHTHSEATLTRHARIFVDMLSSELRNCGAAQPEALGRSLAQEVRAIARAELMAGHRLPWQRQRLVSYMEGRLSYGDGAASAA